MILQNKNQTILFILNTLIKIIDHSEKVKFRVLVLNF